VRAAEGDSQKKLQKVLDGYRDHGNMTTMASKNTARQIVIRERGLVRKVDAFRRKMHLSTLTGAATILILRALKSTGADA